MTPNRSTVWSGSYAHDEPVAGKDVSAVVAAMDECANGLREIGLACSSISRQQFHSTRFLSVLPASSERGNPPIML